MNQSRFALVSLHPLDSSHGLTVKVHRQRHVLGLQYAFGPGNHKKEHRVEGSGPVGGDEPWNQGGVHRLDSVKDRVEVAFGKVRGVQFQRQLSV